VSARNRELLALIPVALLVTIGFTAVFIVESSRIGDLSLIYGGYFLAVCLGVHLFIRVRLPHADPYLFPLCALLAAIGLVMLFRIDEDLALKQASIFVGGAALLALTILLLRDYHVLQRYRYVIATTGILLLLAPRLPGIGSQVNGAYLGIDLGPLSFQPAEVAKICVVVFLASYLYEKRELLTVTARRVAGITIPPLKHFGPLLVVWGASMVMLVYIRDLGSSLMFFGAFLALLYVATTRLSYVVAGLALFFLGAWVMEHAVPHVGERIDIWLDPWERDAPAGAGQIQQSLFAQADGGLFGQGLGESLLRLPGPFAPDCSQPFPDCGSILPAPHTDEIYALIVSELGLFGAAAVVVVYGLIAARGLKTAVMARDGFSKLLAAGLTAVFAIQAVVIIGGVVRLIPLTGVTLPFVSFGGSSVVANMILLGLLLMISNDARRPPKPAADRDADLEPLSAPQSGARPWGGQEHGSFA
jgi:cell division protein FtsW (lipid II flippase)